MPSEEQSNRASFLAPDDAFALLGNETRVDILQALASADGPVPFTDLRERVGIRQGAQFNYHLDKLVGHFVAKSANGYTLRQPGRRVVMAVISGAVTDTPEIDMTPIDMPCTYCDQPVEINYRQERLEMYCTSCRGAYRWKRRPSVHADASGHLGGARLPPAGLTDRTPHEVCLAALTWEHLQLFAASSGICPACAATVAQSVEVCEHHDVADGLCEACDQRFAIRVRSACTNCIFEVDGLFINGLIAHTAVQAFLTEHGINLLIPESNPWARFDFEEEVVSSDPFVARLKISAADDAIVLTIDDALSVIDVDLVEDS